MQLLFSNSRYRISQQSNGNYVLEAYTEYDPNPWEPLIDLGKPDTLLEHSDQYQSIG